MAEIKFITKNAEDSGYKEKYKDDYAIYNAICYAYDIEHNGEKNLGYRYIGGWGVDIGNVAYEMELLARLHHKWSGVRLRHWIISFTEQNLQKVHKRLPGLDRWQILLRLGYELTECYANRYQLVFSVHWDHGAGHLHVVMNTVSYVDGRKYSGSKAEYYGYEAFAKSVAARYGFPIFLVKDDVARKPAYYG